ncbi:AraC family transcriptional regulator [Dactylosporangium sp. CA-139066]|uniref:AraC family transcriptional regulator n=1 Tax=Dactylosporangium sp. CA-139066 TaxID=3239930 RepID=UPI003D906C71
MTTLFETTDIEAAHQALVSMYGQLRLTVTGTGHHVRLARHPLGPIDLHHDAFTMSLEVDTEPLPMVAIGHVLRGRYTVSARRHRTDNRAGDLFIVAPPGEPFHTRIDGGEGEGCIIDPALLTRIAGTAPGRAPRPMRFTGYTPVSARAARFFIDTYAYVRDTVVNTAAAEEPLLAANAARMLIAAALVTFPNNALHEPTIEDRHDAHPAALRRAVGYIDANAHRDISAADIAAAAHVTIRTLQLAFHRHLATTPTAYLRRVRLEHAHRELLAADPSHTTVGAVAARWGFVNHSRFTAHYRAAFGLPPSATLRQ